MLLIKAHTEAIALSKTQHRYNVIHKFLIHGNALKHLVSQFGRTFLDLFS